jgi:tol-pal system protein YbgF
MNRLSLAALPLLLIAAGVRADIKIEERSLSGPAPVVAAKTTTAAPAGAAAAGTAPAGGAMWDQYTQLQQLQQQIGQLQGMVEQQGFLIEKLQNDLRVRYTDLDQRLTAQQEMLRQQPAGTALPVPGAALPAAMPGTAPAAISAEEQKAWSSALGMYQSGGPDKAIPPMLAFVNRYPNSSQKPSAHYFLGQFYLGASVPNYDAALRQFNMVVTDFPNSPKAPDALYQIGAILDMQHKPQEARAKMLELKQKYPQSAEAAKADSYLQALEAAKAPAPEKSAAAKPAVKPAAKAAAAKPKSKPVSKVSKKN